MKKRVISGVFAVLLAVSAVTGISAASDMELSGELQETFQDETEEKEIPIEEQEPEFSEGDSSELRGELTEILMAQDFQDLTGQIIKRVINLVNEVEKRLVEILTVFGAAQKEQKADKATVASIEPEGPILNPHERIDAVSSQDEVDDLLSSLGF